MLLEKIISAVAASAMLLNGSMQAALPDKNVDGTLYLVNRSHAISEFYEPLVRKVNGIGLSQSMRPDAADAMDAMIEAAKQEAGLTLTVISGYRSYSKQATIYARKVRNSNGSTEKADRLVARPGTSEHQLGLAMDLAKKGGTNLNENFAKTAEGKWVYANAHRFGFIVRYMKDYETVTGYNWEPWHVRYVGTEVAKDMYDADIPMELYMSSYKMEMYDFLIYQATND